MRLLILTDIHGNMPALEAVLASSAAQGCDRVYSLGDHTGFGPQPRQAHERLLSLGAVMLLGNHDARLNHLDNPALQSRNWALLHWIGREMRGIAMDTLPAEVTVGQVMMTHAVPGCVERLIYPEEAPAILDQLPDGVTLLLSGHNHIAWDVTHNGRRSVNPGSVGMQESGTGAAAGFAVVDTDNLTVTRYEIPYDISAVKAAYLASGSTEAAPIFTRLAYHTMETGQTFTLPFMQHAKAVAARTGLAFADDALWTEVDRTFAWPVPVPSEQYWKELAKA